MKNATLAEVSYRASLISARSNELLALELKALHTRNAAKGCLKSGATIKESARIARSSIQGYFAELEKFVRECPNGDTGSDGAIVNAVSSSTTSLITTIYELLTATATLVGDADLVKHTLPAISEELSASQEIFRSNLRAHWLKSSSQKASSRTEKTIFVAEIVCFILTLVFAVLWVQNPSGNYDSLTTLFGLGSAASELGRRLIVRNKSKSHT